MRTLLLVDDQEINILVLSKFLKPHYNILSAHNGLEALDILRNTNEEVSAIILDIVMPKMNGYEFLDVVKKDSKFMNIPVIVSSGNNSEESEIKALELGAQDFIGKPYNPDIIKRRLENIISLRESAAIINRNQKDELTGVYNKQFFIEKIRKTINENPGEHYDVICMGIERFKLVNEIYGVQTGDELLRYFAKQLSEHFDCEACGRFSADEFYLLVKTHEYTNDEFVQLFSLINKFHIDHNIMVHTGVYHIKSKKRKGEEICDRAKLAAEENYGKHDIYFTIYDDQIRTKLLKEEFIISNMDAGIKNQEFVVYYQPKYNLSSEMVAGAEALVRWNHPEKGFMSPGDFIPLFERNGFISKLDRYVWERVCKDMKSWMDKGYPMFSVSINISRADIFHNDLADFLLGLLSKYKIPIRYLHLEITESAYTENPDQIINVVSNLRDLGFTIEMDDFGSGYSSLNMLADMPVDILKMDMKFVQTEEKNSSGKGVMSFVISLAKWLNLAVIAEGVETKEQISLLRSMDCNYVQGFYYAKPMEVTKFEELLQSSPIASDNTKFKPVVTKVQDDTFTSLIKGREMVIVDDIEMNRTVLAAGFMDDYKVIEKENGLEGWKYIEEHYEDIDVVMLDLLMPVMDGFQLLEKIRNDVRSKHLPVIITSQGDEYSEKRAMELNANDFVSKPYNLDIIRHRVFNVVAGYRLYELSQDDNVFYEELIKEKPLLLEELKSKNYIQKYIDQQKEHYDIVRLVDPRDTIVYADIDSEACDKHACFSVWNKSSRCENCVSLKAFEEKSRKSKLEYKDGSLYYVISEYVPFKEDGAIVEMVNKIEDKYVDKVIDKSLFYANIKEISNELESDPLTKVKNRRFISNNLLSYIVNAKRREKELCLAMIDVDCFKKLNDTYGHVAGDKTLIEVAKVLETNIALSKGDFVARFGGDEFIVVCRDISYELFVKRMNGVVGIVNHVKFDERDGDVSISMGCVSLNECLDATPEDLISKADKRLYKAKEQGKGCVVSND